MGGRLWEGIATGTGADLDAIVKLIPVEPRRLTMEDQRLRPETDQEFRERLLEAYRRSFDGT